MILNRKPRRGTVLMEAAFVYPVLFLILLGIIFLSITVFRYQQVTHVAREASRWASVHGAQYARENNTTAATPQDVYDKAIAPFAVAMEGAGLSYAVTWNTDAAGNPVKTPTSVVQVLDAATGLNKVVPRSNTVTVTITYTWDTGLFGSIPVTSTSVNTIFY